MLTSIVPFVKLMGMSTNVGMSKRRSTPGELRLAASVNATLSALRPLYSAGVAVTVCNVGLQPQVSVNLR